jgi:hypothetical protein
MAAARHQAGLMAPGPIILRGKFLERSNSRRSLLTDAILA